MGFFLYKNFCKYFFAFNGICYCSGYPRFGCKRRARLWHYLYGACLSRHLFIICKKCSRTTSESGLLQCSFQLILCRSFLNFALSKFLQYLCSLHFCWSFALDEDGSIKNWISWSDITEFMFPAVVFSTGLLYLALVYSTIGMV